ncbi:ankyrin and armadillo repeat-containing protein isoform X2 [Denticeps clupeoides]|uniref:ankyrin and armadillo repeat-containing protein isoform X2 n=1 Tax=Denticeps clupeoides TaxID=299321 RepID=UPI0010A394D3|nr:ankyrin and armadillo repeat-containing protein isoform X2 [Denticeps clupeoides]
MARSPSSAYVKLRKGVKEDDSSYRAMLAAQRDAAAFFEKYDGLGAQELLSFTTHNWPMCSDDFALPVDVPPGVIKNLKNFTDSSVVLMVPLEANVPLDYKVIHQIIRELTVGIYCFNQVPAISLEPNYDQSTTCQLTPAYCDTKVGQILISIDCMIKALWHGAFIPRDKRIRFSDFWRSSMGVDANGDPQTKKDMFAEFLTAGLIDVSADPSFQGIYSEVIPDPIYDPNDPDEETLFHKHSESILLKMTSYLTSVCQHENLFVFEGACSIASVVRLPEEMLELASFQRLQQRLTSHARLVREGLEQKAETCQDLAYLKIITFLVPLLVALKKKLKIPDLSQMLPCISDDNLKTERELPPLMLGPKFSCKHFPYKQDKLFHLHGGIEIDVGTPAMDEISKEIKGAFTSLQTIACDYLKGLFSQEPTYKEHLATPVSEVNGKRYHVISIKMESFYAQHNTFKWWEALLSSIRTLRAKRLPMTDIQLHEMFKKTFGYKKAIHCKNVAFGLRVAAERGLSAAFLSLSLRNSASHLGVLDNQGYSLLHRAAANNKTHIICQLAAAGVNLNQTRRKLSHAVMSGPEEERKGFAGLTPMHQAAQCGSLEALSCLLAFQADYTIVDQRGWMAIHFAAYYGQVACIQALCRKDATLVEVQTSAEYRTSPLLLSATSGSVEALDYLLSVGADWRRTDSKGNNAVHLATLYYHIDILEHIIRLNLEGLPVWTDLVDMLKSEDQRKLEMSIRCLEVLSLKVETFWRNIMDPGGFPALVEILSNRKPMFTCMAAAVVCHMSENMLVCKTLVDHGIIPVLVRLLNSQHPELHTRCSVILCDLAGHNRQYQDLIAQLGGVPLLVKLLGSSLQDVLVSAVRCIRTLCVSSPENRSAVAQSGGIPHLVEFLTVKSDVLQEEACLALSELARGHRENQDLISGAGAVSPLVQILRGRRVDAQVKAAKALEALADHNFAIQTSFLKKSAAKYLLHLLKVFQLDVREQGAVSLWALAGQTLRQQKQMAEHIGYHFILDLLLSPSDKMQYVGCQGVIALSRECRTHQDGFCEENGVPPLVRLLRSTRTKERTLRSVITALGSLCIGIAHTNNTKSQRQIFEEKAIPSLLELFQKHSSLQIKVQVAQTLACVLLGNQKLQRAFWEQDKFSYKSLLDLLQLPDQDICLEAGYALSLFAYNNTAQQTAILQTGGIPISIYEPFLNSKNLTERAKAGFQIVVLARVITGTDQVTLSARGVTVLSELLRSQSPCTVVLTAQLLASLTHTRAGIPDAMVTMGVVQDLSDHLHSKEEEVRTACASALGYLTFNRRAHRLLLVKCRNAPLTYHLLMQNLSEDARMSRLFTDDFRREKTVGLPSLSLEINGGPPVQHHFMDTPRRTSTISAQPKLRGYFERTRSAPAAQQCTWRRSTSDLRSNLNLDQGKH